MAKTQARGAAAYAAAFLNLMCVQLVLAVGGKIRSIVQNNPNSDEKIFSVRSSSVKGHSANSRNRTRTSELRTEVINRCKCKIVEKEDLLDEPTKMGGDDDVFVKSNS